MTKEHSRFVLLVSELLIIITKVLSFGTGINNENFPSVVFVSPNLDHLEKGPQLKSRDPSTDNDGDKAEITESDSSLYSRSIVQTRRGGDFEMQMTSGKKKDSRASSKKLSSKGSGSDISS